MNPKIRVMICDDSAVIRRLLASAITEAGDMQVVFQARHGKEAVDHLLDLQPDIVITDLEMPEMDGIDTVRAIRQFTVDLPVIVFSSLTSLGSEAAKDAISAGANYVLPKPSARGHVESALKSIQETLVPKIHELTGRSKRNCPNNSLADRRSQSSVPVNQKETQRAVRGANAPGAPPVAGGDRRRASTGRRSERTSVVLIGTSTGGPAALRTIISQLPGDFPVPVLITQHMPGSFLKSLSAKLDEATPLKVALAEQGKKITAGDVLIAPGDRHLCIRKEKAVYLVELDDGPPENSCRPAVDAMFRSAASNYGAGCLAAVLTGMGSDGKEGAKAIKERGGICLAQDEPTSVVWGMPGEVVNAGLADKVLPIDKMINEIMSLTHKSSQPNMLTP